jgi:hypothetical protein
MPPIKDGKVEEAIAKDNGIKIPNPQHNVHKTEDQVWLQKATIACTQILECIQNGLKEEDGCVMAGISLSEYEDIKRRAPQIVRMIEKEKVSFKLSIMKPIIASIKQGDSSKAMQMAERMYPSEFGPSAKRIVAPTQDNTDPLSEIVARVQAGEGPGSTKNKRINDLQHQKHEDD